MNEWRHERLGNIASIEIGGTPSRDIAAYWAGEGEDGYSWVSIADLGPKYVSVTRERITELGVRNSNVKRVSAGTMMMSFKLTIGRSSIAGADLYTNEAIAAVAPIDSSIDSGFLYYALPPAACGAITDNAIKGATLNKKKLRDIRIRIPLRVEEQRVIARVLATVDETIEQTEALIAKSRQVKAGLMHDLFTRGVTANGQLRPEASSSKTPFGTLPKGWIAGSLLDVADDRRQAILTGPFGADLGSDDFAEEGIPVLRIGNVQAGDLDLADLLFVTPRKASELQRYAVRSGDLLFARQGATTGRNALASELVDGCLINYHIIRVALDHDKCVPIFIEAAFNGEMVKRQIERDKGRGTREGINTAQLKALKVPLAPVAEQRMIAEILGGQHEDIQCLVHQLGKLRKVKRGLMQDLLTGRVRVPPTVTSPVATDV